MFQVELLWRRHEVIVLPVFHATGQSPKRLQGLRRWLARSEKSMWSFCQTTILLRSRCPFVRQRSCWGVAVLLSGSGLAEESLSFCQTAVLLRSRCPFVRQRYRKIPQQSDTGWLGCSKTQTFLQLKKILKFVFFVFLHQFVLVALGSRTNIQCYSW